MTECWYIVSNSTQAVLVGERITGSGVVQALGHPTGVSLVGAYACVIMSTCILDVFCKYTCCCTDLSLCH
jgi:hypothetical protein